MKKRGRPYNPTSPKHHPLFRTHANMRERCNNPKNPSYPRYGGRGIRVCSRWDSYDPGFKNFLEDMGERPKGMTLDRRDNNKGYCKSNCRWATHHEQARNTRINLIPGRSLRAEALAAGVNPTTAYDRYHQNLPPHQPRKHGPNPKSTYVIDGIPASLYEHAVRVGTVTPWCAYDRVKRGWSPERAVKTPKKQ
jgi:hypothetical protein